MVRTALHNVVAEQSKTISSVDCQRRKSRKRSGGIERLAINTSELRNVNVNVNGV